MPTVEEIGALNPSPDLLWLTQSGNPSGIFIDSESVRKIIRLCSEKGIYVFSDEIFFLLSDSALGSWTPAELSFAYGLNEAEKSRLFFADGLAKSFAAGGLRCGFIACPDRAWAEHMRNYVSVVPQAVLRSWDRLYSVFLEESPHQLIDNAREFDEVQDYLLNLRSQLSEKRSRLYSLLQTHGVADNLKYARRGGIFLMAKLADRAIDLAGKQSILINPDSWARTPGWARLCIAVEDGIFDEAFARLEQYLARS